MATTNFNEVTKWYLLPINYVGIVVNSNTYNFYKNLDKSTIDVNPVLEPNDLGGQTVVGYTIDVKLILLANDAGSFITMMKDFKSATSQLTSCIISLGQSTSAPTVTITTSQSALVVKDWTGYWNMKIGTDTEIEINLKGVFSVDMLTVTSPIVFVNSNM